MSSQRYFIAKYVPDVRRMEPINIGVIVWAGGRTASKFLGPDETAPFVNETSVYRRWLDYWQGILSKGSIDKLDGERVPQSSPLFADELLKTQRMNYQLVEAGEVFDKLNSRNIAHAAEYIFDELVARKGKSHTPRDHAIQLKFLSSQAIADAGIDAHEEFHRSYPIVCSIGSVQKSVLAHYAIGNGHPERVFQRVQIKQSQSVCGSSFLFEQLIVNHKLRKENCASLIYADEAGMDEDTKSSIAMLGELSTVVNVRDRTKAVEDLNRIVSA